MRLTVSEIFVQFSMQMANNNSVFGPRSTKLSHYLDDLLWYGDSGVNRKQSGKYLIAVCMCCFSAKDHLTQSAYYEIFFFNLHTRNTDVEAQAHIQRGSHSLSACDWMY